MFIVYKKGKVMKLNYITTLFIAIISLTMFGAENSLLSRSADALLNKWLSQAWIMKQSDPIKEVQEEYNKKLNNDLKKVLNKKANSALTITNNLTATQVKILEIAGEIDANVNTREGDTFLLIQAAGRQNLQAVQLLIAHGADVNMQTQSGITALIRAAMRCGPSDPPIVQALIKANANVNLMSSNKKTALDFAWESSGTPEGETIIKMLQDAGAKTGKEILERE
jgi:uncharacterized protein